MNACFGFQRGVTAQPHSKAPFWAYIWHIWVSLTFCLSYIQNRNGGLHILQSKRHWGAKEPKQWPLVQDLAFIPRFGILSTFQDQNSLNLFWPSTHTVYLRSDAEGADILPKDLMSCWLTEWVFIIVELQFSMCFERLIDNGKSSINSRVLAGPWWFVLHLRYFHITPGISSGNAFVDVLTASLSSNLQGTDNYCCGGSLPLRQAKIWMQVWNCSQGKLYLSCIIRG